MRMVSLPQVVDFNATWRYRNGVLSLALVHYCMNIALLSFFIEARQWRQFVRRLCSMMFLDSRNAKQKVRAVAQVPATKPRKKSNIHPHVLRIVRVPKNYKTLQCIILLYIVRNNCRISGLKEYKINQNWTIQFFRGKALFFPLSIWST